MDYKDYINGQSTEQFWFKSKLRLIDILLKKIKKKQLTILNMGAGTGADLEIINQYGQVYVIDINKKALALIPSNLCVEKKLTDATNLPFPDDFFDVICSFDVYEHIKDDTKAVSESLRVLKKGGHLIFTVPAFNSLYSAHDKALNHYRRYSKKSIYILLKDTNFQYLSFWNTILFIPLALLRIFKKKSPPKTDYFNLPSRLEKLFLMILQIENNYVNRGKILPYGLSLIGICKK
ncbi:MAG: class I SAM-dependent methyltransferase [Promethearchaeota archaeon]|nr:MAG: class I SAM-dependent methyltransferase [Candidatus Lokiarchaeota archaeon]